MRLNQVRDEIDQRRTLLTVEGQMQSGFEYRAADGAPTGLDLMIGTRPHPSAIG